MSQHQKQILEITVGNPTPDPEPSLQISVDVEVEQDNWPINADEGSRLCRSFALATISKAHRLKPIDQLYAGDAEMAVRLTSDKELGALNYQYRGLNKPTNVLSFAALDAEGPALLDGAPLFLGDIAIAGETVVREAREQKKTVRDHLAHMVVHGTLHLLGFDHENEADAEKMEAFEREILCDFDIEDPYQDQELAL